MKKLIYLIAFLASISASAQWIDASNTTVVGLTEKNTDSIMSIDGEGKMGYTLKSNLVQLDWDEIGGNQSDINLSGFTNDAGFTDYDSSSFSTDFQASNLNDLSDVEVELVNDGDLIKWNDSNSTWEP